jgi:hypothetical protein
MARKIAKLTIGGELIIAKRGIPNIDAPENPQRVTCPVCREYRRKRTPIADCTQYGFTWDFHLTMFRCKCGAMFFHEYIIWHDKTGVVGDE